MKNLGMLFGVVLAGLIGGCAVDAQVDNELQEVERTFQALGTDDAGDTGYPDTDYDTGYPDTDYDTGYPDTDYDTGYPDTDYDTGYPDTDYDTGYSDTDYDTGYSDTDYDTGYPDTDYDTGYSDTDYDTGYSDTDYDTGYPDTDTLVQPVWCELDWNCDDVVDGDDWLKDENNGFYSGFVGDTYTYYQYHAQYPEYVDGGYYHEFIQCGFPSSLDWNGNGIVDANYKDAKNGEPAIYNLNTFYTQHWLFTTYPSYYSHYYPASACNSWL